MSTILEKLEALVRAEGFTNFGFAEVTTPFSIDLYDRWIADGMNGEMDWLARHAEDKREPQKFFKRARTAIVVTASYVPHPSPQEMPLKTFGGVALYARGRDYHRFFHTRLRQLCAKLTAEFAGEEFTSFTDAGPVLERDLALRAGLGFIGKNTCLIDRQKGSLFLIGEIYTSLTFPVARLSPEDLAKDFCGTCTRCLDACPTGALVEPRKLDARKCISYMTIESKDGPPVERRAQVGNWLFGCDICQTVCPWNIRVHGTLEEKYETPRDALVADLRFLLTAPNRQLERDFEATPLARINGIGLKRNAMVVAANQKLVELRDAIERHVENPRNGEIARWALAELDRA